MVRTRVKKIANTPKVFLQRKSLRHIPPEQGDSHLLTEGIPIAFLAGTARRDVNHPDVHVF